MQVTCHPRLGGALIEGGGHRNLYPLYFLVYELDFAEVARLRLRTFGRVSHADADNRSISFAESEFRYGFRCIA